MTRKVIEEIDNFKIKIKTIRELIINTIEYDYDKLINDLNIEKWLEIERIKKKEIKLEKIKLSKTVVDTIKKSVVSKKCLYYIWRQKILFLIEDIKVDKKHNLYFNQKA